MSGIHRIRLKPFRLWVRVPAQLSICTVRGSNWPRIHAVIHSLERGKS